MKKRILTLVFVAILIFTFTGCGNAISEVLNTANSMVENANGNETAGTGTKEGVVGQKMRTKWFNFTVDSAEIVDEYAGYTAAEGMKLIDVVVAETSTVDESLNMGTFDFMLDDPADEVEEYKTPLAPLDDTMMPEDFTLLAKETVTYHLIFEVDASSSGYTLLFEEAYTDADGEEGTGKTFEVKLGF